MKKAFKGMLLPILIGFLCIGLGVFCIVSDLQMQKRQTACTAATVLDYDINDSSSADGTDIDYYVYVHYLVDEQWYEGRYDQPYSKPPFAIGEEIEICYNPDNPRDFSVKGDNRGLGAGGWMLPAGCGFLVFSGIKIAKSKQKKKKTEEEENPKKEKQFI